jgi:hypothetical protein
LNKDPSLAGTSSGSKMVKKRKKEKKVPPVKAARGSQHRLILQSKREMKVNTTSLKVKNTLFQNLLTKSKSITVEALLKILTNFWTLPFKLLGPSSDSSAVAVTKSLRRVSSSA